MSKQVKWDRVPDATHYHNGLFYKYSDGFWRYWDQHSWLISDNPVTWFTNLIAKPPKTYMPKIGEECKVKLPSEHNWQRGLYVGDASSGKIFEINDIDLLAITEDYEFCPILTERELKAIELYRFVNNDDLYDYEIIALYNFESYVNVWDTLAEIK